MPSGDPQEILLRHNRWSTANIIEACRSLSDEQFRQRFELGPGSLHDTLTHILGALRGWGDLLAGRQQRTRLEEEGPHSVDRLAELLESIHDDFDTSVRNHDAAQLVTGSRGGRTYTFARGAVMTHVTTHGMHHRAQCLNMLRRLGIEPLPASSVVEWIMQVDEPPPTA